MSMGIIDLVGRGLGCESCGIVSASRPISFHAQILLELYDMARKSHILETKC